MKPLCYTKPTQTSLWLKASNETPPLPVKTKRADIQRSLLLLLLKLYFLRFKQSLLLLFNCIYIIMLFLGSLLYYYLVLRLVSLTSP